jgi:hypothetical protein
MTSEQEKLLQRVKDGKEWLILNRLEWLDFHGQVHFFDLSRYYKNWNLYLDLFDEAYIQGLVEPEWHSLFNQWSIEDLMPELKKIFPAKRFKDHIDSIS